jgi:hypothetical protein
MIETIKMQAKAAMTITILLNAFRLEAPLGWTGVKLPGLALGFAELSAI